MKFNENISAFKLAHTAGHPILEIYSKLICLELVLYDHSPIGSHKVLEKIRTFARNLAGGSGGHLESYVSQVEGKLTQIHFSYRNGTVENLYRKDYPGIRYTLHTNDFESHGMTPHTSAQDLSDLNNTIDALIQEAKKQGMSI